MPSSLKTLITWAATSRPRVGGSGGKIPTQQVAYLGKASSSVPWFPYGLDANVPTNVLSVLLGVLGRDSKAHLPGSPGQAPETDLGEVQLYHPPTGSRVHLLADGSIKIEAGGVFALLEPSGGITLEPGGGPVTVDGDLVVTGSTTLSATVTSAGKNIGSTHTHLAGTYLDSLAAPVTGISGIPI